MIQTLAPYGALLMAFTVEWYVTHHTSSFLLLLFGPFSPVVWLIPLYILRTMFGHIYFMVVFHLSPVVRGPACSFIRFLYCNRDVSDDNLNCARDTRKKTGGGSGDGTTCEARDRVGSSHGFDLSKASLYILGLPPHHIWCGS